VLLVAGAEARREQDFHRLAKQLLARVAESQLRLAVHDADQAAPVDDDHGIGGGLQESPELALGRFSLS
jgi:hypothetical protein